MPHVLREYREDGRDLIEVCPLDECKHEPGEKRHWVYEYPEHQDREQFVAEVLDIVARKR